MGWDIADIRSDQPREYGIYLLDKTCRFLELAGAFADFITGEVLAVNGGSSAGRAFLPLSTPKPS